jgi:hypothetical protein
MKTTMEGNKDIVTVKTKRTDRAGTRIVQKTFQMVAKDRDRESG